MKKWFEKNKEGYVFGGAPTDECQASDFKKYQPSISVSASQSSNQLNISAKVDAPYGVDTISFYVNDSKVSSGSSDSATYTLSDTSSVTIKAVAKDKNGNEASDSAKKDISAW